MSKVEDTLQSPEQIADHLRVTYVPTYLLAAAAIVLLAAFIVWGFLGNVSDKAYYSGVVFPLPTPLSSIRRPFLPSAQSSMAMAWYMSKQRWHHTRT